jgi:hypothetical protein
MNSRTDSFSTQHIYTNPVYSPLKYPGSIHGMPTTSAFFILPRMSTCTCDPFFHKPSAVEMYPIEMFLATVGEGRPEVTLPMSWGSASSE